MHVNIDLWLTREEWNRLPPEFRTRYMHEDGFACKKFESEKVTIRAYAEHDYNTELYATIPTDIHLHDITEHRNNRRLVQRKNLNIRSYPKFAS